MLAARKIGNKGPAAGRDQYAIGGQFLPVGQADLLRPDHGRARLEDRDLMIVERLAVEPFEPRHLGQPIVAQPPPVEGAIGPVPAKLATLVRSEERRGGQRWAIVW